MSNKKTAVVRSGSAEINCKAIRMGSSLWSSIHNRRGHTKINASVKKALYIFLCRPQVVKSPIANDLLKVSIDGPTKNSFPPSCYYRCILENSTAAW